MTKREQILKFNERHPHETDDRYLAKQDRLIAALAERVEVELENMELKSWRILEEVL